MAQWLYFILLLSNSLLKISLPENAFGTVTRDLAGKREGKILHSEPSSGSMFLLRAEV